MIGKLIAYFINDDEVSDVKGLGTVLSLIVGVVATIAIVTCVSDPAIPFPIHLSGLRLGEIYGGMFLALFIWSGFSHYEKPEHRGWALVVSFLWPVFFGMQIVYWSLVLVIGMIVALVYAHHKLSDLRQVIGKVKLPSIKKQVPDAKVPSVGAYRDNQTCQSCGKPQ